MAWTSAERSEFHNLAKDFVAFQERADHLKRDLDEERAARRDQERVNAELRQELAVGRQENALVRQRLDDHLKQSETWEARKWGFATGLVLGLFSAVLSLLVGLLVTFVRK